LGGDPAGWPADLAQFAKWWLADPGLAPGGADLRVPPRGPAGAKLMALVAEPERDDRERLLSGEHGKLLASFFAKAGVDESEVYFAAALPRHTPMADWRELRQGGLDKVLLHHIALVRPERLILFGQDVTALFGHNSAQNPDFLLDLNHHGGSVRALAARSLDHMLRIPSARKRLWQDWLDWTDG
jgi:DNA polymerase